MFPPLDDHVTFNKNGNDDIINNFIPTTSVNEELLEFTKKIKQVIMLMITSH